MRLEKLITILKIIPLYNLGKMKIGQYYATVRTSREEVSHSYRYEELK